MEKSTEALVKDVLGYYEGAVSEHLFRVKRCILKLKKHPEPNVRHAIYAIIHRYGLFGRRSMTFKEIGQMRDLFAKGKPVTPQRAYQVCQRGLRILRVRLLFNPREQRVLVRSR